MEQKIHIIITGGTIDSVFDCARDSVVVNDSSAIAKYLNDIIRPHFKFTQEILTMKDSRDITDHIRADMVRSIEKAPCDYILITHGTYTMPETAQYLLRHLSGSSKRVVLTGSMYPLQGFAPTDATFNMGFAIGSLLLMSPGIGLAMNGKVFSADVVVKNTTAGRFETLS